MRLIPYIGTDFSSNIDLKYLLSFSKTNTNKREQGIRAFFKRIKKNEKEINYHLNFPVQYPE